MTTPAGWYSDPDPAARGRERRWDGQRWTDETRPVPTQPGPGMAVGGQHTAWADVRDGGTAGGPPPAVPKKKGIGPTLVIAGVIVAVVVIVGVVALAVGGGDNDAATTASTDSDVITTEPSITTGTSGTTAETTETTEAFVEDGTRDKPLAVGDEGIVGDWGVKVIEIKADAGGDIEAANDFNDPPSNGRYMSVRIEATYDGDEEGSPDGSLVVALSGSDGVQYKDFECGAVVSNESVPELEPGGKATFGVCLDVKPEAIAGGVLFVEELVSFDHEERQYWTIP